MLIMNRSLPERATRCFDRCIDLGEWHPPTSIPPPNLFSSVLLPEQATRYFDPDKKKYLKHHWWHPGQFCSATDPASTLQTVTTSAALKFGIRQKLCYKHDTAEVVQPPVCWFWPNRCTYTSTKTPSRYHSLGLGSGDLPGGIMHDHRWITAVAMVWWSWNPNCDTPTKIFEPKIIRISRTYIHDKQLHCHVWLVVLLSRFT